MMMEEGFFLFYTLRGKDREVFSIVDLKNINKTIACKKTKK
jgi:hypothetical protein